MYPVTARYLDGARRSGADMVTATHANLVTAAQTPLQVEDGTITDDATSNVRRSLSLTMPGDGAVWAALNTQGGEITVTTAQRYVDHAIETIPMGVFIVDQEQLGYSAAGQIQMTCPDRWLKIQRNGFGLARSSIPGNMAWQEIQRLVEGAWPAGGPPFPGWSQLDKSATTKVGQIVWEDGSRENAIVSLCQANAVEVYFDREGLAVLRPVPTLAPTSPSVWTVDASASGVMIDGTETRDRTNLRNAIIASTSATDVVFSPVEVTYTVTGDPLSTDGPLGYVPENWSSAALRNSAQARIAAQIRLRQRLGTGHTLSLTAVPNRALDSEDIVTVIGPRTNRNLPGASGLHILDSVVHPLTVAGSQDMQTRSTRPITDGG